MARSLVCRVLAVQRHRRAHFLYVASAQAESQIIVSPSLTKRHKIRPLSVLFAMVTDVPNDKGKLTPQIDEILFCVNPSSEVHGQSVLACVTNLARGYRMFRHRFIEKVSRHFEDEGFHRLVSPLSMSERGTSRVAPVRLVGRHVNRYLKITHELELKREMAYTLEPFFEIGYVARDVYEGKGSSSEYLILEFVTPSRDVSIVSREITSIVKLAAEAADDLSLKHRDYASVEYIDVNDCLSLVPRSKRVQWFEEQKKHARNTIYLNAPTSSALVKEIDGDRGETVWVVDGNSFAHGYRDENDYDTIYQALREQKRELALRGTDAELSHDFLDILKLGVPDSVSMGFGLDRFLAHFLEYSNLREMRRNRHWKR